MTDKIKKELLKEQIKLEKIQHKREKFLYTKKQKEEKSFASKVAPYKKFLTKRMSMPKSSSAWKKRMAVRFVPPTENSSYLHGNYLNNPSNKQMLEWN